MAIANKTGFENSMKVVAKNNNQKLPPIINLSNKTMRPDKAKIVGGLYLSDKNFKQQTSQQKNRNINYAFKQDDTVKKSIADRPLSQSYQHSYK